MRTSALVAGFAAAVSAFGPAHSAAAASVPLTLVVAAPPGGQSDIVARLLQEPLAEQLRRKVVIVNKPGAAGAVAAAYVAGVRPENATIYLGPVHVLLRGESSQGRSDAASTASLVTFRGVVRVPYGLASGLHLPVSSVPQLIDYANAHPGKLNYASSGNGSVSWLAAESLRAATGIDTVHVPYHGIVPGIHALLAGDIDFVFGDLAVLLPYHRSGRLRLLGSAGGTRSAIAPDVPTLAEQGITGFDVTSWVGVAASPAASQDLQRTVGTAIGRVLQSPDVVKRIAKLGYEILDTSGPELDSRIRAEIARYRRVERHVSMP